MKKNNEADGLLIIEGDIRDIYKCLDSTLGVEQIVEQGVYADLSTSDGICYSLSPDTLEKPSGERDVLSPDTLEKPSGERDVIVHITDEANNLLIRHYLDESSKSKLKNFYVPDNNLEAKVAMNANSTVAVNISDLRLHPKAYSLVFRTEDGFIECDDGYMQPNKEEQKIMNRLGFTPENLKGLNTRHIEKAEIRFIEPWYVEELLERSKGESLWPNTFLYTDYRNYRIFSAENVINYSTTRCGRLRAGG